MAWIESHQDIGRHPKTRKLARILGIGVPAAIGHLHLFWWWAIDFAPDSYLTKYEPEDIADAAIWTGDAKFFFDSLMDAGWIDRENLRIHDWHEYAGKLIDRRKADLIRKKEKGNIKEIQKNSSGIPEESIRNSNSNNNSTLPEPLNTKHIIIDTALPREPIPFPDNLGKESKPDKSIDPIVEVYDAYSDLHKKIPGHLTQSEISSIKRLVALDIPSEFITETMRKVYDDKKHREDEVDKIGFRPPNSFKYYEQSIKDAWQINLSLQQVVVIDSSGLLVKPITSRNGGRQFNQRREKPQMVQNSEPTELPSEEKLAEMRARAAALDKKFNNPSARSGAG